MIMLGQQQDAPEPMLNTVDKQLLTGLGIPVAWGILSKLWFDSRTASDRNIRLQNGASAAVIGYSAYTLLRTSKNVVQGYEGIKPSTPILLLGITGAGIYSLLALLGLYGAFSKGPFVRKASDLSRLAKAAGVTTRK